MKKILSKLDQVVGVLSRLGVLIGLVVVFGLLLVGIVARPLGIQVSGYAEIVELCFIWITMLGTLALWRNSELYNVEIFQVPAGRRPGLRALVVQIVMITFFCVLAIKGGEFAVRAKESTPFMRIPKINYYAAIPICSSLMAFYSLGRTFRILYGLVSAILKRGVPLMENGVVHEDN